MTPAKYASPAPAVFLTSMTFVLRCLTSSGLTYNEPSLPFVIYTSLTPFEMKCLPSVSSFKSSDPAKHFASRNSSLRL